MGHVIRVDNNKTETESVLTETGAGGLFSTGYLRDKPATAYLEADETPVFVLTNEKRGVEIDHQDGADTFTSGSGYRTIAVATDRRIVIIVGDSSAASTDGDQCLSVQLVDVDGVSAENSRREGRLALSRANGETLTIHCGSDGLEDAAAYLTAASQAWIHVENTLDGVKRSLVTATGRCDAGEYDAALEAAQDAYHGLNEPRRTANSFDSEWSANALTARIDQMQKRCAGVLADVRRGRGRRFSDEAESLWREEAFEAAHDGFERAAEELETVLTYDSAAVENRDEVHAELERVERMTTDLKAAPLRQAVTADRAATEAEEPTNAAPHWEDALDAYRVVLELDWGADDRRFAGDPDQIRDRLGAVVEQLINTRRSAAATAKRAGEWHVGTEQYEVAIDEFETAREQFDRALAVARDRYPDATEHLVVERDAVDAQLERARAGRAGEPVDPVEVGDHDDGGDPTYDVEATIGDSDTVSDHDTDSLQSATVSQDDATAGERADDGSVSGSSGGDLTIERRLRNLDEESFTDVVLAILAETGWTSTPAPATADHDLEATRETQAEELMLVYIAHRPDGQRVEEATVDHCASLRQERPDVDTVMLITSSSLSNGGTRYARNQEVRLLDDECLSAIVESRNLEDALATPRIGAE